MQEFNILLKLPILLALKIVFLKKATVSAMREISMAISLRKRRVSLTHLMEIYWNMVFL